MAEEQKDNAQQKKNNKEGVVEEPIQKPADSKAEKKPEGKETTQKSIRAERVRPTNCIVCNKAFKHKRWYYRNGKYFCTKRCWKKFVEEAKKETHEKVITGTPGKEPIQKVTKEKVALKTGATEKTIDETKKSKGQSPEEGAGT